MKSESNLTAARLRELVRYDADGTLHWRAPVGKMKTGALGAPAGHGRRLQTIIEGRAQYIHRLIWLHHHGAWPSKQVDHVNGNKRDNRIENLREATNTENAQNVDRGGVNFEPRSQARPWRARITVDGKTISLGQYATRDEARDEYLRAKQVYHDAWVTGVGRAA